MPYYVVLVLSLLSNIDEFLLLKLFFITEAPTIYLAYMATTLFLISFAVSLVVLVPSQSSSLVAKFKIYQRHSDKVTGVLGGRGLPKQGTVEYYSAWITHDRPAQARWIFTGTDFCWG
ncbi:unnamed protein product [Cuscuta europaea]|uniref:Uncharacterized protein n=1 Tax=Cuscuta europaea TaxID=41803 RepID=A0A9P0ZHV1_CUSEU|nr:unnamed protein product [Cuscuta europaea]